MWKLYTKKGGENVPAAFVTKEFILSIQSLC
jgi:hypothetical protein